MIAHDIVDLSRPRRLHLLGIGGSGMTPFARLLRREGHVVTGADACESKNVRLLRSEGVPVLSGSDAELLPDDLDAVIYTAAIPQDAAPLKHAALQHVRTVKYARAVGLFAAGKQTCAVAGTHGKTTTTAMLAHVLRRCGHPAACLVGGAVPQLDDEIPVRAPRLVVEACEYDRSFLHLEPEIAIVTNIEADHLDYYRDVVEIRDAFQAFSRRVSGLLVLHEDLKDILGRAGGIRARVRTFGASPDADLRVLPLGCGFTAGWRELHLQQPGYHNALNAAAVLLVARELDIEFEAAREALQAFLGVGRRLQVLGRPRGVPIIDDYAHHPTEVAAGLKALRDLYAPRRLWVVFQPHQYSRLRRFIDEFARVLTAADRIVIPEIFAARDADEDRHSVSAGDLVDAVNRCGGDAVQISDFSSIVDFVRTQARTGDVVVTMGAGNVGDVAGRLVEAL